MKIIHRVSRSQPFEHKLAFHGSPVKANTGPNGLLSPQKELNVLPMQGGAGSYSVLLPDPSSQPPHGARETPETPECLALSGPSLVLLSRGVYTLSPRQG